MDVGIQAVEVVVALDGLLCVCSVCIPAASPLSIGDLEGLIGQLSAPFLMVGDFGAHSEMWGFRGSNKEGLIVEQFLWEQRVLHISSSCGGAFFFSWSFACPPYRHFGVFMKSPR